MTSQDRTSEFFSLCQSLPPPPPNAITSSKNPNSSTSTLANSTSSQISTGRYSSISANPKDDTTSAELRAFHQTASLISRDIYTTTTLLNELTTLIQTRSGSLFVDETPKVNDLVLQIKNNIETLNTKLDDANRMINRHKRTLGKNSQKGMEVSNLVGQLQEEFVNTTKGFKDVLRVRSDRMKEKSDRKNSLLMNSGNENHGNTHQHDNHDEEISLLGNKPKVYNEGTNSLMNFNQMNNGSNINNNNNNNIQGFGMGGPRLDLTSAMLSQQNEISSSNMPGGESTMQLPRPYGIRQSSQMSENGIRNRYTNSINNNDNLPTYSGSLSSFQQNSNSSAHNSLPVYTPLDIQEMEAQSGQSQMMQLIPDQNYLRERADAMEAVEANIVELGTIFNKLAVMVNEHSELVTRIDDNVDQTSDNLTLSLNTLTDTLTNLRSNRALFFKVLSVLVTFIIFFIVFFA